MPTGYTAKLCEEGQSFRDFALTCARAFGALIDLRDEPLSAPIPESFPLSTYADDRLAEAKAELTRLSSLSSAEQLAVGDAMKQESVTHATEYLRKEKEQVERLTMMAAQVRMWVPPSEEHEELKRFMLEQIETSGTSTEFAERRLTEATLKEPIKYFFDALAAAGRMVDYHADERVRDKDRNASRNEWVAKLRASLPNQ